MQPALLCIEPGDHVELEVVRPDWPVNPYGRSGNSRRQQQDGGAEQACGSGWLFGAQRRVPDTI